MKPRAGPSGPGPPPPPACWTAPRREEGPTQFVPASPELATEPTSRTAGLWPGPQLRAGDTLL